MCAAHAQFTTKQNKTSNNRLCADEAVLYLHIDPVLEAALRLRLHQPVTVLWRLRAFLVPSSLSRGSSFLLATSACFHRRCCFSTITFFCVVVPTMVTRGNLHVKDNTFTSYLSYAYLNLLASFSPPWSFFLEAYFTVSNRRCHSIVSWAPKIPEKWGNLTQIKSRNWQIIWLIT